jgi:hypothetical protein
MSEKNIPETFREKGIVLQAFSRALGREAHVLTRQTELLWQQMYNRLQWEGKEVKQALAPELEKRCAQGARPWAQTRIPYRESEALLRTLTGHTDQVTDCAFSQDGAWIVSASLDKALKIRGINNASKMHTLYGRPVCKIKAGMVIHSSTNEDLWKGR